MSPPFLTQSSKSRLKVHKTNDAVSPTNEFQGKRLKKKGKLLGDLEIYQLVAMYALYLDCDLKKIDNWGNLDTGWIFNQSKNCHFFRLENSIVALEIACPFRNTY